MNARRMNVSPPPGAVRLLAAMTFMRGFLFWCAISSTTAFVPILAAAVNMRAVEAAVFVSAAAVGRVVTQPLVGVASGARRARMFHLLGLGAVTAASLMLFIGIGAPAMVGARIIEGFGVSAFVVSWRTLLNRWVCTAAFRQISDNAIVSQNAGRLAGPLLGGALASVFGLRAVFGGAVFMGLACLCLDCLFRVEPAAAAVVDRGGPHAWSWRALCNDAHTLRWLLAIHHIEFFCMGLWLAAWPVFAQQAKQLSPMGIGASFAAAAAGGFMLPALRRFIGFAKARPSVGTPILLLMLQPLAALTPGAALATLLPCMVLGGLGGTMYFSAFHWTLAHRVPLERTAAFYGWLGSTTYVAQALGQGAAAAWQSVGHIAMPVALDAALLAVILAIGCFMHSVGDRRSA